MSLLRYRIQYFLKAKGRHGTHSPFIYRFVEDVLRKSKDANLPPELFVILEKYSKCNSAIVRYLKLSNAKTIKVKQASQSLYFENIFAPSISDTIFKVENILITDVVALDEFTAYDAVIVLTPHANTQIHEAWINLKSNTEFPYQLDMWHWGLLLKNENFKEKQYFLLR